MEKLKKRKYILIGFATLIVVLAIANEYIEKNKREKFINSLRKIELPLCRIIDIQYLPKQHGATNVVFEHDGVETNNFSGILSGEVLNFIRIGDTIYAVRNEKVWHIRRNNLDYVFPKILGAIH